ncbi:putative TIM-barrel fold metal-dependent hydrolase [Comamonas sp. BIGb0124]|uniref:amidohydrolase family protein n=1 Tax=Comamonas sp. BIGb0124 TaxID=2485130 RepID=UPI000F48C835|nr:amidohydrolase family protein [Comamonas sp. BIGb0124]ROR18457.1 putative TIM-barrel fold metal-dependent hydrolase [Comamonas sp. BIGb0124]
MDNSLLDVTHSPTTLPLPPGSCDCHVHVFGPPGRYSLSEQRTFMPHPVTVQHLMRFQDLLGIDRSVVVQASPQGTDNRCLLDTLAALEAHGRQARGVAVVGAQADDEALQVLHRAGVRGLRVNLQSFGISQPEIARQQLADTARLAARMGWHVQIYAQLTVVQAMADVIARLGVPVVVDHFGLAHAGGGTTQPGFSTLLDLVKEGSTYVKLSAPYRIIEHPLGDDAVPVVRALIECRLDRMLWGTDWPHTNPVASGPRPRDTPEPLRPVDDGLQFDIFARWTDEAERQAILVANPERLYQFPVFAR